MIREIPIEHLLSKSFLRPQESAEAEATRFCLTRPANLWWTRFGRLRLGLANWETPECGNLPTGLEVPLRYWVTPWANKPRPRPSIKERIDRRLQFPALQREFASLVHIMDWKGWVGPPVDGILLQRGSEEVFIFTDGNRRIGISAAVGILSVPVKILPERTFTWDRTLEVAAGRFSEADTRRIWEHCFERVKT